MPFMELLYSQLNSVEKTYYHHQPFCRVTIGIRPALHILYLVECAIGIFWFEVRYLISISG